MSLYIIEFVQKVLINNILPLVEIMAWRQPGDKQLSEPWWLVYWRICASPSPNEWSVFRVYSLFNLSQPTLRQPSQNSTVQQSNKARYSIPTLEVSYVVKSIYTAQPYAFLLSNACQQM